MEENKSQEQTVNTEEIKKETVEAVNQVKDTIKNVDIKKDAKEATGFVKSMFKDPFGTIKQIAEDTTNKALKIAIIFVVIWMVAEFLDATLAIVLSKYWTGSIAVSRLFTIIKTTVAPIVSVLVLAGIVFFMNKENKKSLTTTITSIAVAKIPVAIESVVSLLTLISSNAITVTSFSIYDLVTSSGRYSPLSCFTTSFSNFCSVISVILTYFSIKALVGEEKDSKLINKFVVIYAIYYVVSLILYYLGIYIAF